MAFFGQHANSVTKGERKNNQFFRHLNKNNRISNEV